MSRPRRASLSPIAPLDPTAQPVPSRDRWLLSYADFITLLLALFVVLYAAARVDIEKAPTLIEGLQTAFLFEGTAPEPLPIEKDADPAAPPEAPSAVADDAHGRLGLALKRQLVQSRDEAGEEHGARLHEDERGIVISLASAEFFPAGGVEIPEKRRAVLAGLAPLLNAHVFPLQFEGHTDDRPIESDRFASNWELSSARAAAVARLFIEEHGLDPRRVATSGYAEHRPLVPNTGPAERAQNRRVEIVVLHADASSLDDREAAAESGELGRLLDALPPIPSEVDESLKPRDLGPPPEDIPLP